MGLRSPYGNGPESLPSPIPNAKTPLPEVDLGVPPKGQQVYREPAGPPQPTPEPALEEDFAAYADSLDDDVAAYADSLDGGSEEIHPIDSKFDGRDVEGRLLFGLFPAKVTKEGRIQTQDGKGNWSDDEWLNSESGKKIMQDVYFAQQEGLLGLSSLGSMAIPGGGMVAAGLRALAAGGGAALTSKFLSRPANDESEYIARKAAGLTDSDVQQARGAVFDGFVSLLGQGVGEAVGTALARKSAKELRQIQESINRAQTFRTAENMQKAAAEVGIELTPDQALAASRQESSLLDQSVEILNRPIEGAERQVLVDNQKRAEKELLEGIRLEAGDLFPGTESISKKEMVGAQEKSFLERAISEHQKDLADVKSEVLSIARKRKVVPADQILGKMEDVISKRLSSFDVFKSDGAIDSQKILNLSKDERFNSGMGKFLQEYQNLKNSVKREVGELGKPQSPLMKDVFNNKSSTPGFIDSQDPLSGLGSPPEYTGVGQGGTLPGMGGDINMQMTRPGVPPQTIGSRVDYPYGSQEPLPGKSQVKSNQFISGDTLSVKGSSQQGKSDKDLGYLFNLVDNVQEAAFGMGANDAAAPAFGELAHELRVLENDVVASVLTKEGRTDLAAKVLNMKDFYSRKVTRAGALQNKITKNLNTVSDALYKGGSAEDISAVLEILSNKEVEELRGQYIKTAFFDAMFENAPGGPRLKGSVGAKASGLFTNTNIQKTKALFGEEGTKRLKTFLDVANGLNKMNASTPSAKTGIQAAERLVTAAVTKGGISASKMKDIVSMMLPENEVARKLISSKLDGLALREEAIAASKAKSVARYRENLPKIKKATDAAGAITQGARASATALGLGYTKPSNSLSEEEK